MKLLKTIRSRLSPAEDSAYVLTINAPVSGRILSLEEINDPTFSEHILGEGVAIIPEHGVITAPADAIIDSVPHTHHAISMTSDNGVELLDHVGIDTVELEGKFFNIPVAVGDHVRAGDVLIEVDLEGVKKAGYDIVTPIIVTNMDEFSSLSVAGDTASANMPFLVLEQKKHIK